MAPSATDPNIVDVAQPRKDNLALPKRTKARFESAGIDLSNGYPYRPLRPALPRLDDHTKLRREMEDVEQLIWQGNDRVIKELQIIVLFLGLPIEHFFFNALGPSMATLCCEKKQRLDFLGGVVHFLRISLQEQLYLQDVYNIRNTPREHIDAGTRADPAKAALLSAAKEVIHLTPNLGTEIVGLQLNSLSDKQKDELALLIAERTVVVFRDQSLTPQEQKKLGEYYGELEVHPQVVPGLPGVSVIWPALQATERPASYRNPGGASRWHSDLVHELHPAGITHLHNDVVPALGGDTLWASGYAAYSKLSPDFRKIIDGKQAVYRSAHPYVDRETPDAGPKFIERIHPLVRVNPATGWKSLWVNRSMTSHIVGLDRKESDVILNYLYEVFETNVDIQVRVKWTPSTSVLWDNRISIHNAAWDYEGTEERHGTRVTSLAEKPYFEASAKTRREALGLADD